MFDVKTSSNESHKLTKSKKAQRFTYRFSLAVPNQGYAYLWVHIRVLEYKKAWKRWLTWV